MPFFLKRIPTLPLSSHTTNTLYFSPSLLMPPAEVRDAKKGGGVSVQSPPVTLLGAERALSGTQGHNGGGCIILTSRWHHKCRIVRLIKGGWWARRGHSVSTSKCLGLTFGKHHPFPCVPNKLSKLVRIGKFRVLNLGTGSMSTHQTGGFIMDLFFSLYAYFGALLTWPSL